MNTWTIIPTGPIGDVYRTSISTSKAIVSGSRKSSGKNKKAKGPAVKKTSKRKPEDVPVQGNKKQKDEFNPSKTFSMLQELLNRSENNDTSCSGFNNR